MLHQFLVFVFLKSWSVEERVGLEDELTHEGTELLKWISCHAAHMEILVQETEHNNNGVQVVISFPCLQGQVAGLKILV